MSLVSNSPFSRFLVTLLLNLIVTNLSAQTSIKGTVIGSLNREPISGVTVTVSRTGQSQLTDAKGEFVIAGNHNDVLRISHIGYRAVEIIAADAALVRLVAATDNLNEVVVTALGIKKEAKRLGHIGPEMDHEDEQRTDHYNKQ